MGLTWIHDDVYNDDVYDDCIAQGTLLNAPCDLNEREIQKGGSIWICIADLLCYAAEANPTL